MALRTVQEVCVRCGSIQITDATGPYDLTTNPTGYGAPNPNFGAVAPYTIEFFAPKATTSIFTLDLYVKPPTPDADGHYLYTVMKEALGLEVLPSGVWRFRVTFGALVRDIMCLIYDDMEERIKNCICESGGCNALMYADLMGAQALFQKFQNDEAQKVMDRLYKKTECCECDCGCS